MDQFYAGGWDAERGAYAVLRDYNGKKEQGHHVAWFVIEQQADDYAEFCNACARWMKLT